MLAGGGCDDVDPPDDEGVVVACHWGERSFAPNGDQPLVETWRTPGWTHPTKHTVTDELRRPGPATADGRRQPAALSPAVTAGGDGEHAGARQPDQQHRQEQWSQRPARSWHRHLADPDRRRRRGRGDCDRRGRPRLGCRHGPRRGHGLGSRTRLDARRRLGRRNGGWRSEWAPRASRWAGRARPRSPPGTPTPRDGSRGRTGRRPRVGNGRLASNRCTGSRRRPNGAVPRSTRWRTPRRRSCGRTPARRPTPRRCSS